MTLLPLGILVMAFGASLLKGRLLRLNLYKRFNLFIFVFSIAAVFSLLAYYSYQQYQVWNSNELTKHFLSQKVNIIENIDVNYFFYYVGIRFFAPYLISLITGIVFFFIVKKLNKKYEERFFEQEELWFGALALFLIGWPGLLFYFIALILIYLIIQIFIIFYYKFFIRVGLREIRVSLRLWWLPLAIFVIFINKWLVGLGVWKLLKI